MVDLSYEKEKTRVFLQTTDRRAIKLQQIDVDRLHITSSPESREYFRKHIE